MWRALFAACLVSSIAGCVNLEPPINVTRYFVLNGPLESTDALEGSIDVKLVGIEPYLATPRMVVRTGTNELRFSDVHRWAEPLADNIRLVLDGHFSRAFSGETLPRLALRVEVQQFEGRLPDQAVLVAAWAIEDMSGNILIARRSEHVVSGWDGADYQQLAGLLQSTLELLAGEIASEI